MKNRKEQRCDHEIGSPAKGWKICNRAAGRAAVKTSSGRTLHYCTKHADIANDRTGHYFFPAINPE